MNAFCVWCDEVERLGVSNALEGDINELLKDCLILFDLVEETHSGLVVFALKKAGCFFNERFETILFQELAE